MALTKVTYSMIEGSAVSVTDFGAVGNGVANDTAAIQAAINTGKDIIFPAGTYLIQSDIGLKSNARLIGQPGAVIYRNTDARIKGLLSSPTLTSLTAASNLDFGSTLLVLNSASYAQVQVGDYLYLKDRPSANVDYILDFVAASTADLNDPSKWIYQVQVVKIVEKLGGNTVRMNAAAHVPFSFSTTATVALVDDDVIENVEISGLTFENGAGLSGASSEAAFFNAQYVYNAIVENCVFNLQGYTGGIYLNFGQWNIRNNCFNESKQLAVFLRQAVPDSVIFGNVFRNQMTGDGSVFIEAHNYNITISGNQFDGARSQELTDAAQLISAIQMDAKVNNVSIIGNNVNGYGVGVRLELGCMFNTVTGNTIENCDISGIRMVQSGQNVICDNTFYNCGLATSAGTLATSQATIFINASSRNIISENTISYDSQKAKPALIMSGSTNQFIDNTSVNATSAVITGSSNIISRNKFESSQAADQVINVTGSSSHYNVIENNAIVSAVVCTYGIRINDGAECNTVRWNISDACDFTVGLTSTSNAQSLFENTRYSASNTPTVNVYNVEISAPVMPTNATMPRRFRIFKTTTSSGTGALAPQNASWWEFTQEITGTKYFQRFDIPTTQVTI